MPRTEPRGADQRRPASHTQFFLEDVLERTQIAVRPQGGGGGGGGKKWFDGMRGGRDGGRRGAGGEAEKGAGGFSPALYAKHSPGVQQSLRNWHQDTAKLDVDLVEQVVAHICAHEPEGAILVFMTGWDDISKLYDQLKSNRVTGNTGKVSGRGGGPEARSAAGRGAG